MGTPQLPAINCSSIELSFLTNGLHPLAFRQPRRHNHQRETLGTHTEIRLHHLPGAPNYGQYKAAHRSFITFYSVWRRSCKSTAGLCVTPAACEKPWCMSRRRRRRFDVRNKACRGPSTISDHVHSRFGGRENPALPIARTYCMRQPSSGGRIAPSRQIFPSPISSKALRSARHVRIRYRNVSRGRGRNCSFVQY